MSKQTRFNASALTVLCALAAFALQARAQEPAPQAAPAAQEGMVVVRDAQTGKMRAPTADELKALRAAAPATPGVAPGRPQQHQALGARGGARGVRLGEKTMMYDVVTRGADGKLSSACLHGDAASASTSAAGHAAHHPANAAHKELVHEAR